MNNKKVSLIFTIIIILTLVGCVEKFTCSVLNCKIKSGEDITFFIATDPHHLSKKTYDDGKAFDWFLNSGDGKLLHYSDEIIDAFTLDIENRKPDILIIPGDLTCNGEKESHLEMAEKLKNIKKLGVHIFVIPGNHDIENPWARNYFGDEMIKIDSITKDEFVEIYSPFGYKDAISRDNHSLSYLAAPAEDVWLLMLDSAKYKRNKVRETPEMDGEIPAKTFEWIKECANLAKENNAQIIAVMHHSLMNHSEIVNEHFTIENSKEVLDLLLECDVQIVLSGHIHLQDIKSYGKYDKTIYDIATSCLTAYPNQYGVLKFLPDKGYEYNTNRVDVYAWAWENDIQDKNLNNFKKYSRDFFRQKSYDKYYDSLLEISKFSDEEMKAISETVAELNLKYFAGFRNELIYDIFTTKGFNILQYTAPFFIRDYVMSMFDDEKTDNNKLYTPLKSK
ncbi:metallophosphoesterase [Clostridium sp. Cult2]|uniref:metallophosphoesterase n=1 Tax=Clostridium sp. Cult2 TaxID=2079003 RepID=UPI001F2E6DEF|nr:metallophosphoesterase [Clostridium sp. Cult2]MCF6465900.1 serine/threonine protein phosphatase [Clostridium sp. Cult2]